MLVLGGARGGAGVVDSVEGLPLAVIHVGVTVAEVRASLLVLLGNEIGPVLDFLFAILSLLFIHFGKL